MKSDTNFGVAAVILAGGRGTRMKSETPKVLHRIDDKPLLEWVAVNLKTAGVKEICVVLGGDLQPFASFRQNHTEMSFVLQEFREGTADAIAATVNLFNPQHKPSYARGRVLNGNTFNASHILICMGDTPAITAATFTKFIADTRERNAQFTVLAMDHPKPTGYGRILSDGDRSIRAIVEEKSATAAEKEVRLCNTGLMLVERELLFTCLARVDKNPQSGEYYLTDCISIARSLHVPVSYYLGSEYREFNGVNDPDQLQQMISWLKQGA